MTQKCSLFIPFPQSSILHDHPPSPLPPISTSILDYLHIFRAHIFSALHVENQAFDVHFISNLQEQIANALFQVCLQTSFTVSSLKLLSLQILSKLCQDADGRIEIEKVFLSVFGVCVAYIIKVSHPWALKLYYIVKRISCHRHLLYMYTHPCCVHRVTAPSRHVASNQISRNYKEVEFTSKNNHIQ